MYAWFGSKGFYVSREWWEDITALFETPDEPARNH